MLIRSICKLSPWASRVYSIVLIQYGVLNNLQLFEEFLIKDGIDQGHGGLKGGRFQNTMKAFLLVAPKKKKDQIKH